MNLNCNLSNLIKFTTLLKWLKKKKKKLKPRLTNLSKWCHPIIRWWRLNHWWHKKKIKNNHNTQTHSLFFDWHGRRMISDDECCITYFIHETSLSFEFENPQFLHFTKSSVRGPFKIEDLVKCLTFTPGLMSRFRWYQARIHPTSWSLSAHPYRWWLMIISYHTRKKGK